MRSKTPPPSESAQDEQSRDDMAGHPVTSIKDAARQRLLSQVADALQVPLAMLYDPPDPSSLRRAGGDGAPVADLDHECEALLDAYKRIQDPLERRRLLARVQEAAERT